MQSLRSHGIVRESQHFLNRRTPDWYYEQQSLGFNYRMSEIHAALGMSQLKALEAGIIKRNELAVRYDEALVQFPIKKLELTANVQRSSYHLYVILLESREVKIVFHFMRKKILEFSCTIFSSFAAFLWNISSKIDP